MTHEELEERSTSITWQAVGAACAGLVVVLIGVILSFQQAQLTALQATVNGRGERIAQLEAGNVFQNQQISKIDETLKELTSVIDQMRKDQIQILQYGYVHKKGTN